MPLTNQLTVIEQAITHADKINTTVSQKSVDWHLDHSLRVIIGICKTLNQSNPDEYKWKFNKLRLIIFTKGSIPRGKGRAPKSVLPKDVITIEEIQQQLNEAKQLVISINELPKKSNFKHPLFGLLHRDKSIKFMEMHTQHHLNIINDIIK